MSLILRHVMSLVPSLRSLKSTPLPLFHHPSTLSTVNVALAACKSPLRPPLGLSLKTCHNIAPQVARLRLSIQDQQVIHTSLRHFVQIHPAVQHRPPAEQNAQTPRPLLSPCQPRSIKPAAHATTNDLQARVNLFPSSFDDASLPAFQLPFPSRPDSRPLQQLRSICLRLCRRDNPASPPRIATIDHSTAQAHRRPAPTTSSRQSPLNFQKRGSH
jgi:hypothetical protein